ncbi:MAG: hypothetical protein GY906_17750 [bacterium]|nr:hypothetical protein [bacterium]
MTLLYVMLLALNAVLVVFGFVLMPWWGRKTVVPLVVNSAAVLACIWKLAQ